MKEKRILNLLGQVNDDYIAEAAPPKSSKSKHHGVKWGIVAACLCLVLAGVLQLGRKPTLSLSLVMTAYAADGTGYELGETPVALLDDMEIGSGSYATYDEGTGHGRSSSLFHIICENENIDTITYTINNEVNAANMAELSQNNAWFATQTITPSPVNDEFPVYATRRSSNGTHAYSYVGNSYTVNYGNQDSTEMYLEYRIDNVNGQWTAKVINITVNVKFKDGSIAEKKLLIQPTYDDSIRELCISVLSEDTEALAEKYLQSAFSFDAKECSPIITQEDDIPNIVIRKTKPIGHYGRLRKAYLEMHRPILFNELVLSDKLFEHCAEIDEAARNRIELIVRSLAEQNGVTEQLKAENQMEWVRQMNACKAQAEEIVKAELIYD